MRPQLGEQAKAELAYALGLPGRGWSSDPRSSGLGALCALVPLAAVFVGIPMWAQRADISGWLVAFLGVMLLWACMRPAAYRSAGVTNQIVLDSGIAVLAIALLGPVPAMIFWTITVLVAELLQRPWIALALVNTALTSASLAFACLVVGIAHGLGLGPGTGSGPGSTSASASVSVSASVSASVSEAGFDLWASSWPLGSLLPSVALACLAAAAYACCESALTEVLGRWITQVKGVPVAWGSIASGQVTALVLGAVAGTSLAIRPLVVAVLAVGIPFVLAVEAARQRYENETGRASKQALVEAQVRIAMTRDVTAVITVVIDAIGSVTTSISARVVTGAPDQADLEDPRVQMLPLGAPRATRPALAAWGSVATREGGQRPPAAIGAQLPTAGVAPTMYELDAPTPMWLRTQLHTLDVRMRQVEEQDLRSLARTAAAAIGRIEEQRLADWRADHDTLTRLLNRSGLWRSEMVGLAAEQPISVLMVDLDGFKSVNDTWGHDFGDSLLSDCAASMQQAISEQTWLARWGGDEFVAVVIGETDEAELVAAGERIIAAVEEVGAGRDQPVAISASVGLAVEADLDTDIPRGTPRNHGVTMMVIEQLVVRADGALYRAKQDGKSTVRSA